ncbi:hypothetical protein [Conexibacter sp. W3-3-2]|uniref:hypothetical protein n=1 Tax=Conexibacter sp. W3-3-2 TaxID=2675227 RepID=UPI0018AB8FBE|nr:hypothetical protein [Conexibacter sp. W3-3-2]
MASRSTVQGNFLLPVEQAEWLREYAFKTRRKQAEIVREALADYRRAVERDDVTPDDERRRRMTERFAQGRGMDLDILLEADGRIWQRES